MRVLNVDWAVPAFDPTKGVWVTLELQVAEATLSIFDAAPDSDQRRCLAAYPFPLKEAILPTPVPTQKASERPKSPPPRPLSPPHLPALPRQTTSGASAQGRMFKAGQQLLWASIQQTARFTHRVFHTMF